MRNQLEDAGCGVTTVVLLVEETVKLCDDLTTKYSS